MRIYKLKAAKNNVKDALHTKLVDYPICCFKYDKNDWHHHDEQTLSHINYTETQIVEFTTIQAFINHIDRVLMDAHASYEEYKTESMLHTINQL